MLFQISNIHQHLERSSGALGRLGVIHADEKSSSRVVLQISQVSLLGLVCTPDPDEAFGSGDDS